MPASMFHYTDVDGYNAIRAGLVWHFQANQPPGNHPFGTYFTSLPPDTPRLAKRLGLPRRKVAYVFEFMDVGDLLQLSGGRGQFVFYSPTDYDVDVPRQIKEGPV